MKLVTSAVFPPIPTRKYDWACIDDDTYDGAPDSNCPIGRGPTEFDAIVEFVRELLLHNDDAQEMLVNCVPGWRAEVDFGIHSHTCQQCDSVMIEECDCEQGNTVNMWCSARCKAAFDL